MVEYIGDGNPDGTVFGSSTSELIAFHGATPTDQYAAITSVTASVAATVSTTAVTASSPYGFVTAAQASSLVAAVNLNGAAVSAVSTAVNSLIAALKEKGLTA